MPWYVFAIFVALFIVAFLMGLQLYSNFQLRLMVKSDNGRFPTVKAGKDSAESLKESFIQEGDSFFIDEMTWYDLDLFSVFQMVNLTYSSIGSEALYRKMHEISLTENFKDQEELIAYFKENPQKLEEIRYQFAKLGKKDFNYLQQYLKDPSKKSISNSNIAIVYALLPFLSIGLAFLNPMIGILLFFGVLIHNVVFYFKKNRELQTELLSMSYFVQMTLTANKITKISQPKQEELKKVFKPFAKIKRYAFSFAVKTNSEAEIFTEYLNMIFLLPFISYNAVISQIEKHQEEAKELFKILGDLEVASALLNFREVMPYTTKPVFHKEFNVYGKDVYHPLLKEPVANDVTWQENTLVTGSNASGKSTYVKSVAISCVLAQTLNIALAESFQMAKGLPLTSMAIEDNIFNGESYFIAEIKSLRRIIEATEKNIPVFCFIDEILKGTNTIERVAASSSIVAWLKEKKALAFVATHDIELTEILKGKVGNIHFSEAVTEDGITFDYKMKEGPSTTRNAIALLSVLDYPKEIVETAKEEANDFEKNRTWRQL